MDELYLIGEVARRTGLSVSAIRFYSDAGIVTPAEHTDAGYRRYDVDGIARLELIRTLRELDAGIDDIRKLLAEEITLGDFATAHLAVVDRQLSRFRARRAVLRAIVRQRGTTEQVSLSSSTSSGSRSPPISGSTTSSTICARGGPGCRRIRPASSSKRGSSWPT
ncbi:MerR family transcriptional regulator [Solwaraspora sp. WMMD792]|uniref:MerR family transcriptional regulator n=1 Tax=Solwaraspora sp. WMMD792 TaxID=3016099 RepID=UPI002416AFAB|nr:MerR family transcriptional regulator [Solwaraspora sp. WMMD792]MDG4773890.1 MerR family transcriptional regulator [Solwaraspora sp. WMMD792]